MITVTIFKRKPYSEKYLNSITGIESYRTMEYPPNHEDVDIALSIIREEKLKQQIDTMRDCYDSDRAKYDRLKGELPICLFAGTFENFSNAGLITPSGLLIVDLDKIPVWDLANVWAWIVKDKYTFASFLSPSGRGYKILIRVDNITDNTSYNEYLEALKDHYNSPYWDDNCKGICRACYLSSDSNLYANSKSQIWTHRKSVSNIPPIPINTRPNNKICSATETSKIINFLEGGFGKFPMTPGNRHSSTFKRAREFAEWGISESAALSNLSQYISSDFSQSELEREIGKAYKWVRDKGAIGTKYRKI